MKTKSKLFTDQELTELVLLACELQGGATVEQITRFINECEKMRAGAILLAGLWDRKIKVVGYSKTGVLYGK